MKLTSYHSVRPPAVQNMDRQLRDASQMYENHFLNDMVKAMRSTVQSSDLSKPSMAEKIYRDKLDQQYVEKWGERGGIGLADMIYEQLNERFFPEKKGIRPIGPLPLDKGLRLKIDEVQTIGLPIAPQTEKQSPDLSYFLERNQNLEISAEALPVVSPWSGQVLQTRRSDNVQSVQIQHEDGLTSTLVFNGKIENLNKGDRLQAGQMLGQLSAEALGLSWKIEKYQV